MEARSPSSAPAATTTSMTPGAAAAPGPAATTAGELSAPGFVSLGMVVLDEIRFPDGRVLRDVAGGSGFYSTLGARLAVPREDAETVCCLVVAGDDFPASVVEQIEDWGVTVLVQKVEGRLSTRGLLVYEDDVFGRKTFRYTNPPLRPSVDELPGYLRRASVVHTLAAPEDVKGQAAALFGNGYGQRLPGHPLFAWEPSPLHCDEAWKDHLDAGQHVDVLSPNDKEVVKMMTPRAEEGPWDRGLVERAAALISDEGYCQRDLEQQRRWTTVVRCGEYGCLTVPRASAPVWLPPYHDIGSDKVVDPTGAGNAFLGAFAVAYKNTDDAVLASAYGAVAASFVIEQMGPPKREVVDDKELWNGEEFGKRLEAYQTRTRTSDTSIVSCHFRSNSAWAERKELFQ
ncbi:pfkB family carbohydrate kinase [Colletotrichum asianum]|uniref:PfkB family carbohydrate kinase n=1 Tax=Colletotrichum asianum TaxID=702518 RepID=A0A8H3WIZ3_9PEZI|nr:pfkB family carbohydrate kinase [Colletotrichum asianum]